MKSIALHWLASLCFLRFDGQPNYPLKYIDVTQEGLYLVVFPGTPTVQAPQWQRTQSGKLVNMGMQQLEIPDAAKANSTYTVMHGPADTTPAVLRQRLATDAARLDGAYDAAFHSNGTIVYARSVTLRELAPAQVLCQEIRWQDKAGNYACFRTFYHRNMAIRATVTATPQTFNKLEAEKLLGSFKLL